MRGQTGSRLRTRAASARRARGRAHGDEPPSGEQPPAQAPELSP
ncbi:hypothetical protein [Actinomadura luteofluorescens]